MNVLLLAAGEGTRFRPHTLVKPKPAIPFLNVPLAFYSLAFLENINVESLVVNTFHLPEKVVKVFERADFPKRKLHFSHEKGSIQGSGGAIRYAEKYFNPSQDIIMMNGDEVILPKGSGWMKRALALHQQTKALATLFVIDHPEVGTKFGGVWTDEAHQVHGIGKTPINGTKPYHFIGVFILSRRLFEYLPSGPSHIFTDVLVPAIQAGEKVQIFPLDAQWFETGNLKDYLHATEECLKILDSESEEGLYLKKILKKFSPLSTLKKIDSGYLLNHSANRLSPGFKAEGFAVIGEGAVIKGPTQIKNCVLDSQVEIKSTAENELFLKD